MVMRFVLLLGLLLLSTLSSAKDLTAVVNRTQLGIGEQLELVVTLSDMRGKRPDIAALQKDFNIDRRTESSNVNINNGIANYYTTWVYLLSPKRKGKLTIPEFTVDWLSSAPIEITVTEMPVAQSTSDDVLIEVELSPSNPYVQSQVAYIQRLYFSRPLVDSASISSPKLSRGDADIQFWGSSDPSYVTHKNRPYQLIERYYLIYPRKAGVLEFEPSVFNGSLASSRSRQRNDFRMNMFRAGTRVNAYSAKASIEIKAKPDSYTYEHWLPATQLTLSRNFSQSPGILQAGEPVTVTIALMAEGLKAEVLPEVKFDLPANLKSYPEKPNFITNKITNGMVGQREEKVVLIANEAGKYVIPEVKVPWWSVTEDKLKFATLEAVTLEVTGGVVSMLPKSDSTANADADKSVLGHSAENENQKPEVDEVAPANPAEKVEPLWTGFSAGLLQFYQQYKQKLLIGLATIIGLIGAAWLLLRRRKMRVESSEYQQQVAEGDAISALEYACKRNNPQAAIAALSRWAEVVGIYPATMSGVEAVGDPQLSAAVKELNAANYSLNPELWNGEQLFDVARKYGQARQQNDQSGEVGLKPLHPVLS